MAVACPHLSCPSPQEGRCSGFREKLGFLTSRRYVCKAANRLCSLTGTRPRLSMSAAAVPRGLRPLHVALGKVLSFLISPLVLPQHPSSQAPQNRRPPGQALPQPEFADGFFRGFLQRQIFSTWNLLVLLAVFFWDNYIFTQGHLIP